MMQSYTGINVRSAAVYLPKAFCEKYVKDNKFVTLRWNAEEAILELTFYPTDSDVSFRLPLMKPPTGNMRIHSAKFFAELRQFKMGRYEIFGADLDRSGSTVTYKFKLEKIK